MQNLHMLSGAERGSKPRNNALHVVCCMETIYLSLRDATNKMFLNPTPHPCAFVHQLPDLLHSKSGPFCQLNLILLINLSQNAIAHYFLSNGHSYRHEYFNLTLD